MQYKVQGRTSPAKVAKNQAVLSDKACRFGTGMYKGLRRGEDGTAIGVEMGRCWLAWDRRGKSFIGSSHREKRKYEEKSKPDTKRTRLYSCWPLTAAAAHWPRPLTWVFFPILSALMSDLVSTDPLLPVFFLFPSVFSLMARSLHSKAKITEWLKWLYW